MSCTPLHHEDEESPNSNTISGDLQGSILTVQATFLDLMFADDASGKHGGESSMKVLGKWKLAGNLLVRLSNHTVRHRASTWLLLAHGAHSRTSVFHVVERESDAEDKNLPKGELEAGYEVHEG